jgi:hypothetical protein
VRKPQNGYVDGCRPLRGLPLFLLRLTWGFAPLHPRLYAVATLRGLTTQSFRRPVQNLQRLIGRNNFAVSPFPSYSFRS